MAMEPLPLGFGDFPMDVASFSSLWSFQDHHAQESMEELKQSLLSTTLDLESAKEEMKRKEAHIGKLVELVKLTAKERDEAREQLQQLLLAGLHQPESPPQAAKQTRVASSVTDSDSHQSYVSSPVDPFFDPVTSSSDRNDRHQTLVGAEPTPPVYDHANAVLDVLAKNKPLPEKGKLLQAVMEAGPLLQNLLVAGPLPRWRNPPPLQQTLDVLPMAMKGPQLVQTVVPSSVSPMLSYPNAQGFCMKRPVMAAAAANCFQSLNSKRQKSH